MAGIILALSALRGETTDWAWQILVISWAAGLLGVLALLVALVTKPTGRGWLPALGDLAVMVAIVVLVITFANDVRE